MLRCNMHPALHSLDLNRSLNHWAADTPERSHIVDQPHIKDMVARRKLNDQRSATKAIEVAAEVVLVVDPEFDYLIGIDLADS